MRNELEFILFVVISAFVINGWHEVTRNGKIFGWWERYWEQYTQKEDLTEAPVFHFPHWLRAPISQCIMCMASLYGTIIFLTTTLIFDQLKSFSVIETIFIWIAYELCLTCANYIVHKKMK